MITINVVGNNEKDEIVIKGNIKVCPPYRLEGIHAKALDNFNVIRFYATEKV